MLPLRVRGLSDRDSKTDVATQTMEVWVEQMTANLFGDRQSLADKCQCVVKIAEKLPQVQQATRDTLAQRLCCRQPHEPPILD